MKKEFIAVLKEIQEKVLLEEKRQSESAQYRNSVRQLFETVASRVQHVVSELLQNADDAGATCARIEIEEDNFVFRHDGADFEPEQLEALCSFAVSSKHTIKTTGFRGIGFKSAFSIGDSVYFITPSYQIRFDRDRFTYPNEHPETSSDPGWPIKMSVQINLGARRELESSLQEWKRSPCSLLFFQNLKNGIFINGERLAVERAPDEGSQFQIKRNNGPVPVWSGRKISRDNIHLPPNACLEITKLRGTETRSVSTSLDILISDNEQGRIYSILPTSGEKRLSVPFAVNGAFVLTPDRDGIKSPSQSPTNSFLFEEIGRTLVQNLLGTLDSSESFDHDLVEAYELLPFEGEFEDPDAETEASRRIFEACCEGLEGKDWIVTFDGRWVDPRNEELIALPGLLTKVWPGSVLAELFCPTKTIIHPATPKTVIAHLKEKGLIVNATNKDLLDALTYQEPPRPETYEQLLNLWTWARNAVVTNSSYPNLEISKRSGLKIIPAEGEWYLKSLNDVYRYDDSTAAIFRENEISLLSLGIYRFDTTYIPEDKLKQSNPPQRWWLLMDSSHVGITKNSSTKSVLDRTFRELDNESEEFEVRIEKLWEIYWKLELGLPDSFPIRRQNRESLSWKKRQVLLDSKLNPLNRELIPDEFIQEHAIADEWIPNEEQELKAFESWLYENQISSKFPRPQTVPEASSPWCINSFLSDFGSSIEENRNGSYLKQDTIWDPKLISHWKARAESQPNVYFRVLHEVAVHHQVLISKFPHVTFYRSYGSSIHSIRPSIPVSASWLRYFEKEICLPDQHGRLAHPRRLYLSNAQTLPMLSAGELAVDADCQKQLGTTLLSALGCRTDLPSLPEIGALITKNTQSRQPSIERSLHLIYAANKQFDSSEEDQSDFLSVLKNSASIPSDLGTLENPENLVQEASEEDEAIAIHNSLKGTAVARALAIPQTADRQAQIDWIRGLPTDSPLELNDLRRLQKILKQPSSISEDLWVKQRRWISLSGTLRSIDDLKYCHSDSTTLPKAKISCDSTKCDTADFTIISGVPVEMRASKPELVEQLVPSLSIKSNAKRISRDWLTAIAELVWTEALVVEEKREEFETLAQRLRDANLILDPTLSKSFTLEGREIASGITTKAAWPNNDLVLHTGDPDEICELAPEISRCIRADFHQNSKLSPKIESWIEQPTKRIQKLGLKALGLSEIRHFQNSGDQDVPIEEPPTGTTSLPANGETTDIEKRNQTQQTTVEAEREYSPSTHHQAPYPVATEPQPASTIRERAEPGGNSSNPSKGQGRHRFLSYIEPAETREQRERRRSKAKEAGDAAEQFVVKWEIDQGHVPELFGGNNPGYDIESRVEDSLRYIEVKSVTGNWGGEGVKLSNTQFEYARRLREDYWLYVVEFAGTPSPVVHRIQDPYGHISNFCIDRNWKEIAGESNSQPQVFVPSIGQDAIYEDRKVVVENVEKRGAFFIISFTLDGQKYKKMNTLFTPLD
ncbi:hypothetical protein VDG1235_1830 [Verrucomicrobiia bacterium DG1235]|nr:hypothetical protein VDG1235_1830 [Verrucomicrobiae bacterium DG1235]